MVELNSFRQGVFFVEGAKRAALYDTTQSNVYSLNQEAAQIMKGENSEMLAQQTRLSETQAGSGPTIELVTPTAGKDMEPSERIICPPNCLPNCPPVCPPNTLICKPFICPPGAGLPRPPKTPPPM